MTDKQAQRMPAKGNSQRAWNLLQFTALVLFLLAIGIYWSTKHTPGGRLIFAGVIIVGLLLSAFHLFRNPNQPVILPRFALPLGGLLLLGFISLLKSPMPYYAWERASDQALLILVLPIFLVSLKSGWRAKIWLRALIAITAVLLIMELSHAISWIVRWFQINPEALGQLPPYRIRGFLLQSSTMTAGFFSLMLPIGCSRLFIRRGWARLPWFLLITALLLALALSASRGAYLSSLAAAVLFGIYLAWKRWLNIERIIKRLMTRRWLLIGASLAIFGAMALFVFFFLAQMRATGRTLDISTGRFEIWWSALKIFSISPILGNGLGGFSYYHPSIIGMPPGPLQASAHNGLLQVLTDLGFIGALLLAWLIYEAVRLSLRIGRSLSGEASVMAAGCTAALATLLVHGAFEHLVQRHLYAAAAIIILGLLLSLDPDAEALPTLNAKEFAAGLAFISLVLAAFITLQIQQLASYQAGLESIQAMDFEAGADQICSAWQRKESETHFLAECGLALALDAYQNPDANELERAEEFLDQTTQRDPLWSIYWDNLAFAQREMGDRQNADRAMTAGLDLAPNSLLLNYHRQAFNGIQTSNSSAIQFAETLESDEDFDTSKILVNDLHRMREGLDIQSVDPRLETIWSAWQNIGRSELRAAQDDLDAAAESGAKYHPARYTGLAFISYIQEQPDLADQYIKIALQRSPNSADAHLIYGLILLERDELGQGMDQLFQSASLLMDPTPRVDYPAIVYRREFIPWEIVPQAPRLPLSEEAFAAYEELATYLNLQNRTGQASIVILLLTMNRLPPS